MYEDEDRDEYHDDVEWELDRSEPSEQMIRKLNNLALHYISGDQLKDKGELLGHYRTTGFQKTYIDIYEKAIMGKAKSCSTGKVEEIRCGYACLKRAVVEKRILYLLRQDGDVYLLRHLKGAEWIAYLINDQKRKAEGEG